MTYDPVTFRTLNDPEPPPPHVVYAARCLDGGWFGRCDGCGWCGPLVTTEPEAWTAAVEHMLANDTEKSA